MPDLHHSIVIQAPPMKVYEAVSTDKGFQGWWTADTRTDPKVGGKAEFGFDNRGTVFHMVVEALEPGKRFRMACQGDDPQWRGTHLDWQISTEPGGTRLTFIHGGWREMTPYCAMCNSTWGELTYRLKDFVEGKNPGPHWTR